MLLLVVCLICRVVVETLLYSQEVWIAVQLIYCCGSYTVEPSSVMILRLVQLSVRWNWPTIQYVFTTFTDWKVVPMAMVPRDQHSRSVAVV